MIFWLGVHQPKWLEEADVPLFVSHSRLHKIRRKFPRALKPWRKDSGGFTVLGRDGDWGAFPAVEYARSTRRHADEIGRLDGAAPQDWMCEPHILSKTGRSVAEHQQRTIDSLFELRSIEPSVPWFPVLQGWTEDDYLRHVDVYAARGVDLRRERVVAVGSICRRQGTLEGARIIERIVKLGVRVHALGFKTDGLRRVGHLLEGADSAAGSFTARRERILLPGHDRPGPGRPRGHKNCANCLEYLLLWRSNLLRSLEEVRRAA